MARKTERQAEGGHTDWNESKTDVEVIKTILV